MENKFQRVEPGSPDRCQSVTKQGQCPYKATDGSNYCPMHCGPHNEDAVNKHEVRNFQLGVWQARVGKFADSEKLKSLREEIGILRIILESLMTRCPDAQSLLLEQHKIRALVLDLEKLVGSCHRLEQATGELLDKTSAINFAGKLVEILSKHLTDPIQLETISNELMLAIGTLTKKET